VDVVPRAVLGVVQPDGGADPPEADLVDGLVAGLLVTCLLAKLGLVPEDTSRGGNRRYYRLSDPRSISELVAGDVKMNTFAFHRSSNLCCLAANNLVLGLGTLRAVLDVFQRARFNMLPSRISSRSLRMPCLVAAFGAVLVAGCAAPAKHYLTEKPDKENTEYAKFEVAYFSYLATMTGAAAIALLGLMYVGKPPPSDKRRRYLQVSVTAFVLAVSLLTTGYAARNYWMMSQQPLKEWFANLDLYVLGFSTIIAYLTGVVSLVCFVVTAHSPSSPQK
jgi:hypothetical protein